MAQKSSLPYPLDRTLQQLRELRERGERLFIDTIEGELPPEKLKALQKLLKKE